MNSPAFDMRFKNAIFSGDFRDEENELEELIFDYKRVPSAMQDAANGVLETNSRVNVVADQEIGTYTGMANSEVVSVDDVVAPHSKRKHDPVYVGRKRTLTPIQEWEGYVESIQKDAFVLRVANVKSQTNLPGEEIEFSINDLSNHQKTLLREGAIVRWVIGLERLPSDQRRRVSELHFRRLPAHSRSDFERAEKKAEEILAAVTWDVETQ